MNHGVAQELSAQKPPGIHSVGNDLCGSATAQDKELWNGFCEIESEPALFNVMLREFGVKGVKVQEVVSLDEDMMAGLSKPVYGLIFLFRWREDDPNKQEASCPEGLWFANQTASNACASVALLNIVNNIEGIELGDNLQHFKEFTMPFTPALRGDAINNFEFIKQIHNSFARKMDILNSDLLLKSEATSKRSRSTRHAQDEAETDAGFHFIAFVPALGTVWKFDGLERQPQALGHYTAYNDWLDLVKPNIRTRMEEYEEGQIEFSILSLAKDPLLDLVDRLALNVRQLESVNRGLVSSEQGGSHLESASANCLQQTVLGPDETFGLPRERIDQAKMPSELEDEYDTCSFQDLAEHQRQLVAEQQLLRTAIREEQQSLQAEDDHVAGRRYDYGPAVRAWTRSLARKRVIENLA
ncbi:cysteine proteinase [Aspergillus steynii IBT 23096]|uniref:Ubiquitin carboxyl-terminal hydrolase n=1 Tax=Aspergillus steynii IBT 23096 TaxID=1392250 RepID=A0A2I2GFZ6_9EURO|nr:cysteine proteinase [Aspergillus steynii IBT 23096]PLB51747.1 cysteine proteinase [Aspergillus steynii IBT 23096]